MEEPRRFGRYTVTGTLGRGAMGQVYSAVDDLLGRTVAVKTLHCDATGRFRAEARAVATLNHPGIVQVFDIDLDAQPPYLVMECMVGPSLRDRLAAGALPPSELRSLGVQIARALAAAHSAGIVHRDVKPANILGAGPHGWKLADFGVAHVPDSSLTKTGQFVGSPAYAPPEALLRGQSTAAGDMFGLGATLYHCAAGRWPRTDATAAELLAPIPSIRTLAPGLPEDLIATIDLAVALAPEQRPTATQLADALAGGFAPRGVAATQFVPDATSAASPIAVANTQTAFVADSMPGVPSQRPWKRWAIGAGVLGVLVFVGALASASRSPSTTPPRPPATTPRVDVPTEIRAASPQFVDRRAAEEWNDVIEGLYEQKFGKARNKLGEWERRWGETAETRNLRQQLDALPPQLLDD